jgi:hypothetical protein
MTVMSDLRDAVKTQLETHFAAYSVDVEYNDIDLLIETVVLDELDYGIVFSWGGGSKRNQEVLAGREWLWFYNGGIYIPYKGDIPALDDQAILMAASLRTLFKGVETLGGVTYLASIDSIGEPDAIMIHDMPFYMMSFRMSFLDKV